MFSESYYIRKEGNFEGRNHLIRFNDIPLRGYRRETAGYPEKKEAAFKG